MRLPPVGLGFADQLAEFDVWITPALGEIRDTDRFKEELARVHSVITSLASTTDNFADPDHCRPEAIVGAVREAQDETRNDAPAFVDLAAVLFLVTGKSDNNVKAQLPIHLRKRASEGVQLPWTTDRVPRVLDTDRLVRTLTDRRVSLGARRVLMREFVSFVLSDERYVNQLWSIGRSFVMLREVGRESDLLSPLVAFQVRGSVSATGGHGPEGILRDLLSSWGLEGGVDFNMTDWVVTAEGGMPAVAVEPEVRAKTRAYDFVLPFRTPGWRQRLFIQAQFYAGDSGSVSHKNVDQTRSSRDFVARLVPDPIFVEFVDGAGYFSSLNRDLQSLLSMTNTKSWFQIRSAPIRLRRELQEIGYLLPIEVEQAVARTDGSRDAISTLLARDGYDPTEVRRVVDLMIARGFVELDGDQFAIRSQRRDIVRRHGILDVAATHGHRIQSGAEMTFGLLVPGYGPFFGIPTADVIGAMATLFPGFAEVGQSATLVSDLGWLAERGWVLTT